MPSNHRTVEVNKTAHQVDIHLPVRSSGKPLPQYVTVASNVLELTIHLGSSGTSTDTELYVTPKANLVRVVLPLGAKVRVADRIVQQVQLTSNVRRVTVKIPEKVDLDSIVDMQQVIGVLIGMEDEENGFQRLQQSFEIVTTTVQRRGEPVKLDLPDQLKAYKKAGGKFRQLAEQAVEEASKSHPGFKKIKKTAALRLARKLGEIARD